MKFSVCFLTDATGGSHTVVAVGKIWGYRGQGNRVVIPSYIVNMIRRAYSCNTLIRILFGTFSLDYVCEIKFIMQFLICQCVIL